MTRYVNRLFKYTPAEFHHEERASRDCAVRALTCATMLNYAEAHAVLKRHGRLDRRGTYNSTMEAALFERGFGRITMGDGRTILLAREAPTVAQFARAHPEGQYVLRVYKHFLALVNGTVHDWGRFPRCRVVRAWGTI